MCWIALCCSVPHCTPLHPLTQLPPTTGTEDRNSMGHCYHLPPTWVYAEPAFRVYIRENDVSSTGGGQRRAHSVIVSGGVFLSQRDYFV